MSTFASIDGFRRGANASPQIGTPSTILDAWRDTLSGDDWHDASELLYALHRLWNEYQSPEMGTSPIDAWDAGDECMTYDYIAPCVHDLLPSDASAQIAHAVKVAERYYSALKAAGKDY